jgi:hypothetical protein
VGAVGGVVDAGAARVTGGVMGAAWGAAEVMGTAWGVAKVSEVGDEGAMKGQAVRLPRVAVQPPPSVPWMV